MVWMCRKIACILGTFALLPFLCVATAVEALDFDVDMANPLHLVRGSLKSPDLVFSNLSRETRRWKGVVRYRDHFGRGFDREVDITAEGGATVRVGPDRDLPAKGIWYVTADIIGDDGQKGCVETRFAAIDRHDATPILPKPFFRMGINFHAQKYWNTPKFDNALNALVASGAKLVRSGGFKFAENAKMPGKCDWSMTDALVEAFRSHGLAINANVYPGPPWARIEPTEEQMKEPAGKRMNLPSREGLFRDYCAAIAERYGTQIDYYEMGNEWDLLPKTVLPPDEALRILREGSAGVKSSCPTATVVTCGWAGGNPSAFGDKWNPGMMERIAADGRDAFDVWAVHLHGPFDSYAERLQTQFFPFREKTGLASKPWYSNETAYNTRNGREGEAARAVWQKILYAWAWGSTDYIWYNLIATGWNPDAPEDSYGLVTPDFHPRATYAAFSSLSTLIAGARFDTRLVDTDRRHVYRFHSPGDSGLTIAGWDSGLGDGETLPVRSDAKSAWEVDLMGNRTRLETRDGLWHWKISKEPSAIVLDGATIATIETFSEVRSEIAQVFKGQEGDFHRERMSIRLEAAERLDALPDRTRLMKAEIDEFKDYFNTALDMWQRDPLNTGVKRKELDAADFGAVGDGATDDTAAFTRAIATVRGLGGRPCVLRIPAGTYLLASAAKTASGAVVHLDLSCLTNCAFVGEAPEKVRFEFGIYDKAGVSLDNSENVTLANMQFSWRETPFSQVTLESFDPSDGTAVVRHRSGTMRPDDPRFCRIGHSTICAVFDASGRKLFDRGPDPFFDLKVEDLGEGRFRIHFDAKKPSLRKFNPRPGDVIVLPDRDNSIAGLRSRGSSFCNLVNVWFGNARSVAISGVGARYLTAHRCRVAPKEDGLVFSTNADAFFNERGTHISHCDFGNMNDDGANSHCKGVDILSRSGEKSIVVRPPLGRLRAGDVLQIVQSMEGRMLGDFRVASVRRFRAKNGGERCEITFTEPLPPLLSTCEDAGEHDAATKYALSHGGGRVLKAADILFAPLAFGTGFTMVGNRIHDMRGCAVNVQCPHAIVEGNEISSATVGLKMSGLTEWKEGPPPYNVVVRGNVFRDCPEGVKSKFSTINRDCSKECPIRWVDVSSNIFERVACPMDLRNVETAEHGGMAPLLAITGRPTEAEVRAKVAAIHAQGIDSFLIYARSGLELEYMGEDWLRLCEWFCDEAERRGMKVWLYDEYNWPSGTCKGRVPAENDSWRYAEWGVFRNADDTYRWESAFAPAGWVNVCEPAAVARFIELTHDVYAKRLDRWFKNGTIVGIFTDEPGHPTRVTFPDGKPLVSFRKYSGLEEEYLSATGRALKDDVERWLVSKEGDVWETYLKLMGRRFRFAYFDQLRSWCDVHGILLTGHLIAENDIYVSARCSGDPMLCLRGETLPAMDDVRTLCDASPDARPIEWVTYNLARQAALNRGKGGAAELFACGPANHVPATLRSVMWMCAMHGLDRYFTCMDVMDERGLVEKHGFLAPTGPIHPWYEKHASVLADEARKAAVWARKTVAEREVAVRYPNTLAARFAIAGRSKGVSGPDLNGLLRTLELNQFTCRLVEEDEATDLPLVFACDEDGRFSEMRTRRTGLSASDALSLCRERLPTSFSVCEQDGKPAEDVLVRTFTDGASAVLNMRAFSDRTLFAERCGERVAFVLPARGVMLFDAAGRPYSSRMSSFAVRSLADVEWNLSLVAPNVFRVNFNEANSGSIAVAAPLKDVRLVTRDLAMSYAVTESGRPVGANERPADGVKVVRHEAEPYAFEMDGKMIDPTEPCTSLRPGYDPLYRQTGQFALGVGEHRFSIVSGEADRNYFLPALFLVGDFAVSNGALVPRAGGKVNFGSLASKGLANFTGTATWSAAVTAPTNACVRLRLDTGGRVTRVVFAGQDLGVRAWAPFEWEIPVSLVGQKGLLEISVSTSVLPMFGDASAGTWDTRFWNGVSVPDAPCGLYAADWLEPR